MRRLVLVIAVAVVAGASFAAGWQARGPDVVCAKATAVSDIDQHIARIEHNIWMAHAGQTAALSLLAVFSLIVVGFVCAFIVDARRIR